MDTNKKTLTVRIVTFVFIVAAIVVLMRVVVGATKTTTQYDTFAQCLTQKNLKFFGAFWCPHCQAQKAEFGGSVKFLPYVECSTPDAQGQTQVCIDNHIESYPTWVYPTSFTITSDTDPTVCDIQPGAAGQPALCAQVGSKYFKVWNFAAIGNIESNDEPTHTGNTWTFAAGSRTTGEQELASLAAKSGCTLPTGDTSSTPPVSAGAASSASTAQ